MSDFTLKWDDQAIARKISEAQADGINAAAVALQSTIKTNLSTKGGGKVIKRKGKRNRYVAAPPGAFPGWRTGRLAGSIAIDAATPGRAYALVGTNVWYVKALEFGAHWSIKKGKYAGKSVFYPARPFLVRSMNDAKAALSAAFQARYTTSLASKFR